jgi:hypothetical protein
MSFILTKELYNIVSGLSLACHDIWTGIASSDAVPSTGMMRILPMPSSGTVFGFINRQSLYQIDIWHKDMYQAETYCEELIEKINNWSGIVSGVPIKIKLSSNQGAILEEGGELWRYIIIIDVAWVKPDNY